MESGDECVEWRLYNHNGVTTPWLEVGRGSQKLPTDKVHWKVDNENAGRLEETKTKSSMRRT
jgi:hypothetical protein